MALIVTVAVAIILAVEYAAGAILTSTVGLGATDVGQGTQLFPTVILTAATFFGIYSKAIMQTVFSGKALSQAFSARDAVLAAVLSPLAMYAIFDAINEIESLLLLGIISFQNGFFFNNLLAFFEGAGKKA